MSNETEKLSKLRSSLNKGSKLSEIIEYIELLHALNIKHYKSKAMEAKEQNDGYSLFVIQQAIQTTTANYCQLNADLCGFQNSI